MGEDFAGDIDHDGIPDGFFTPGLGIFEVLSGATRTQLFTIDITPEESAWVIRSLGNVGDLSGDAVDDFAAVLYNQSSTTNDLLSAFSGSTKQN